MYILQCVLYISQCVMKFFLSQICFCTAVLVTKVQILFTKSALDQQYAISGFLHIIYVNENFSLTL